MKTRIFSVLMFLTLTSVFFNAYSQKSTTIAVGYGMGGTELLGVDFEFMPSDRIGLQVGGGLNSTDFDNGPNCSMDLGVNFHFRDGANSPFVSLQYYRWIGSGNFSYIAPVFVFRANKLFQAGVGLRAWSGTNIGLHLQIGLFF